MEGHGNCASNKPNCTTDQSGVSVVRTSNQHVRFGLRSCALSSISTGKRRIRPPPMDSDGMPISVDGNRIFKRTRRELDVGNLLWLWTVLQPWFEKIDLAAELIKHGRCGDETLNPKPDSGMYGDETHQFVLVSDPATVNLVGVECVASSVMAAALTMTTRRLMKDLQEVKESPLFNVIGEPEEGNLFVWHVNIRSSEGEELEEQQANPLTGAVFHLILEFPSSFPAEGPTVHLCTPLPHPNVALQPESRAKGWPVSLWNCTPAYKGWSSAYSVQSVLLQLQAFLLQEDLLYDVRKVSMQQTVQRSRNFVCEGCGHAGLKPVPAFLTSEEIEVTLRTRLKKLISNPNWSLIKSLPQPSKPQDDQAAAVPDEVTSELQTVTSRKNIRSLAKKSANQKVITSSPDLPPAKPSIEVAMGHFGPLPQEALTTIMCSLSTEDLSSISRTCRGLKAASEDGYLWKLLLHRHFPATSLHAASLEDWKHVFLLQQNNIIESLCCFHTKCTFEEEVLGFPISFTVNPRTHDVDYIQVHLDILSRGAYASGVLNTADNQNFKLLLPLYITQDHFERALPMIQSTIVELCPLGRGVSKAFRPEMVLDVMPKVLNTMVVLLCDKGVGASERAIEGYCMMHRLFLALCQRFNLWSKAEQEVVRFRNSPGAQTKEQCPDLGRLMARLSVCFSEATAWKEIVRPLTNELFDRTVIWICKHDPSVAKLYEQAGRSSVVDEKLLLAAWEGSRVALRLNMFHDGFLHLLARPSGSSLKKVTAGYDALYGMPSAFLKKRIQDFIKKVITTGYDWPFFFRIMGMQVPTKVHLTQWLGQCWKNSLRKGYHKRGTRFENIQRRGVSTILLKGESYSAPVNMTTVKMLESWRWSGYGTRFLDASCLLYDGYGDFKGLVDYCHTEDQCRAIRHSGDVIDHENQQGHHTIEINLSALHSDIKELYFTMSGFEGATLSDFRLPFVQLKDVTTDVELCEYTLEDKTLSSHTSVIMCRMYRSGTLVSRWEVEALGHLGKGAADNYDPIKNSIRQLINGRSGPSP